MARALLVYLIKGGRAMKLSQVIINNPLEFFFWVGILAFLIQGLVRGFLICCQEPNRDWEVHE